MSHARRAHLRTRHRILQAVRRHFDDQGFIEVETPAMVPSPGLDFHLDAFQVTGGRAPRYLHTSPEYQMKRLLVGGLPRIYQLCKAFRRDERGHLHNPEFSMLEWYRADADAEAVMRDTEQLVAAVATAIHGQPHLPGLSGGLDVSPPWPRLRVDEAFQRLANVDVLSVLPDEDRFFRILIERIEPRLGRGRPTFLTHYPASMASLARVTPEDPRWAERFEVYVDGVELANGFGELTDPVEQRARLERDQALRRAHEKDVYPIDERFLAALEEGMPESGGNALGIDRLVMLTVGAQCIDDVMAFTSDEL